MRLRGHKYGAKPTVVDGIRFASQKEAKRYDELKLLEKAGEIHRLTLQHRLPLQTQSADPSRGAVILGHYVADFAYCQCGGKGKLPCIGNWPHGVIEDVKGFKTPLYKWKKKHVEAQYGIVIREI